MDKDKKMHPVGRYWLNQALAIDQLLNVMGGGDPDETVSSRLGKLQRKNGGSVPWYRPLSWFIARGLDAIEKDHCKKAIEEDEGKNGLFI